MSARPSSNSAGCGCVAAQLLLGAVHIVMQSCDTCISVYSSIHQYTLTLTSPPQMKNGSRTPAERRCYKIVVHFLSFSRFIPSFFRSTANLKSLSFLLLPVQVGCVAQWLGRRSFAGFTKSNDPPYFWTPGRNILTLCFKIELLPEIEWPPRSCLNTKAKITMKVEKMLCINAIPPCASHLYSAHKPHTAILSALRVTHRAGEQPQPKPSPRTLICRHIQGGPKK